MKSIKDLNNNIKILENLLVQLRLMILDHKHETTLIDQHIEEWKKLNEKQVNTTDDCKLFVLIQS